MLHAGITEEQVDKIGERTARLIYNEIVELTYPGQFSELQRMIEEGEYTPPTEEEIEESKKNS